MPESKVALKLTKVIKTADKLVQDIRKSTAKLAEAIDELKGLKKEDRK